MWKAERFDGDERMDPVEQMLDFVNTHRLRPGHFEFAIATDEEGEEYCVMLYATEEAGKREPPERAPREQRPARPSPGGERRPGRFPPASAEGEAQAPGRRGRPAGFKPGRGGEESRGPWSRGGRPGAGGPAGDRRPGGGRPGGGRPKSPGGPKRPRS